MHDPSAFGARGGLNEAKSNEESLERFLFRERPNPDQHRQQHAALVSALRDWVEVVYLSDLLSEEHQQTHAEQLRFNPNLVFTHDAMITIPWLPDGWIRPTWGAPVANAVLAVAMQRPARLLSIPSHLYLEGGET
jgi:hypothetical protein